MCVCSYQIVSLVTDSGGFDFGICIGVFEKEQVLICDIKDVVVIYTGIPAYIRSDPHTLPLKATYCIIVSQ